MFYDYTMCIDIIYTSSAIMDLLFGSIYWSPLLSAGTRQRHTKDTCFPSHFSQASAGQQPFRWKNKLNQMHSAQRMPFKMSSLLLGLNHSWPVILVFGCDWMQRAKGKLEGRHCFSIFLTLHSSRPNQCRISRQLVKQNMCRCLRPKA